MGQVIPKLTFPSRSPSRTTSQSVDTQKAGFGTATTGMWLPSTNQILPSFCHLLFYLKLNGWQLSIATGYPSNHIFTNQVIHRVFHNSSDPEIRNAGPNLRRIMLCYSSSSQSLMPYVTSPLHCARQRPSSVRPTTSGMEIVFGVLHNTGTSQLNFSFITPSQHPHITQACSSTELPFNKLRL
jgi:hypothetical protein